MKKTALVTFLMACLSFSFIGMQRADAHCQIPCGIYGDDARFEAIFEHIDTIEKSMKTIAKMNKQRKPDRNQLVRWVNNKDDHADQLAHIVTYYFMAQRLTPPKCKRGDKDKKKFKGASCGDCTDCKGCAKGCGGKSSYMYQLKLLHKMLVHSMKAKQTTDLKHVEKLRKLTKKFFHVYNKKSAGHEGAGSGSKKYQGSGTKN